MTRGTVVSLCDLTGNMVRPWADAGFDCLCIDTQHSIRADRTEGRITYRWADVRSLTPADLPDPTITLSKRVGWRFWLRCLSLSTEGATPPRVTSW